MGLYNIYKIPKSNGKFRTIADPSKACRLQSEEMLDQLWYEINRLGVYGTEAAKRLHAYIPERGCKTLVDDIYTFLGDTSDYDMFSIDVKDYFSSICKDEVVSLNEMMTGNTLHIEWFNKLWAELHPDNAREFFPNDNIGIAQGNPACPTIANLVGLYYIDTIYNEWYHDTGIQLLEEMNVPALHYSRYSDNIYIVAKRTGNYSRTRLYDSLKQAFNNSPDFKFSMTVCGKYQSNVILGMRMGENRPRLTNKKWLRNLFHRIRTKGTAVLKHEDVVERFGANLSWNDFTMKVKGLISYSIGIEPDLAKYIEGMVEYMEDNIHVGTSRRAL